MTTTATMPSSDPVAGARRVRDPRLDVFRGIAMFIILIAHTPGNFWTLWIPARFGFSDATEIFVFCSGMASAIAFGRVFDMHGLGMGTARVVHRIWQVYWAHIGVFLATAMAMAVLTQSGLFEKNYINSLNLKWFFDDTVPQLIGFMTLTYVPNYFDILPMYIVLLAMMPLVMALHRVHPMLVVAALGALWLGANTGTLWLPAEPWTSREWFFNPFGWQLVFYTGFAFMRGWLPRPKVTKPRVIVAAFIVLAMVPFAYFRILNAVPELRSISNDIQFLTQKTDFGILRYVHFLALAYVAWAAAGEGGARFIVTGTDTVARIKKRVLSVITKVGQQSLAVFVFSMFFARLMGVALDVMGRTTFTVSLVNLIGFAAIIGVAYLAGWFKSNPWKPKRTA